MPQIQESLKFFMSLQNNEQQAPELVNLVRSTRRVRVYRDDSIPAFGGWCAGSLNAGDPTILLNVAACLLPCINEEGAEVPSTTEEKKWLMISTLMHEFGHALQEFFDLEFTEERIEELVTAYERHYLGGQHDPLVRVDD